MKFNPNLLSMFTDGFHTWQGVLFAATFGIVGVAMMLRKFCKWGLARLADGDRDCHARLSFVDLFAALVTTAQTGTVPMILYSVIAKTSPAGEAVVVVFGFITISLPLLLIKELKLTFSKFDEFMGMEATSKPKIGRGVNSKPK